LLHIYIYDISHLRVNAKIDKFFQMNANDIEEVNKFSYVGSVVTSPVGEE